MVLEKNISKYDKGILVAKFSFLPFMKRLSLQFTKQTHLNHRGKARFGCELYDSRKGSNSDLNETLTTRFKCLKN